MTYINGEKVRREYQFKCALNVAIAVIMAIITGAIGDDTNSHDFFHAATMIFTGMAVATWLTAGDFK